MHLDDVFVCPLVVLSGLAWSPYNSCLEKTNYLETTNSRNLALGIISFCLWGHNMMSTPWQWPHTIPFLGQPCSWSTSSRQGPIPSAGICTFWADVIIQNCDESSELNLLDCSGPWRIRRVKLLCCKCSGLSCICISSHFFAEVCFVTAQLWPIPGCALFLKDSVLVFAV